jgi:putative endonuclease
MKHFTSPTQRLGQLGEQKAVEYLAQQGFIIVERNVSGRYGEIDIVAKKGSTYYFFEVKAAKQGSWFNPAENLTKAKLGKFFKSVDYYTLVHGIKDYRIEGVLVLLGSKRGIVERIELF